MVVANTLAYCDAATIASIKNFFLLQALAANPDKKYWRKFTQSFCKLDRYSVMENSMQ